MFNRHKRERCHLHDSGDVLDVICQRTICQQHITVGVQKRWNREISQVSHHIRVARHAQNQDWHQRSVHIRASLSAMLAHALHAPMLALSNLAFVERSRLLEDVSILIMRMAGAAGKNVAILCPAENTLVNRSVMRECAAHAMLRSARAVFVARRNKIWPAVIDLTSMKATF